MNVKETFLSKNSKIYSRKKNFKHFFLLLLFSFYYNDTKDEIENYKNEKCSRKSDAGRFLQSFF